jgi:hypothetical protein
MIKTKTDEGIFYRNVNCNIEWNFREGVLYIRMENGEIFIASEFIRQKRAEDEE